MMPRRVAAAVLALAAAALLVAAGPAVAQDAAPAPAEPAATPATEPPVDPASLPVTLMFSLKERVAIEAAMREGGLDRSVGEPAAPLRPFLRTPLYLSGILWSAPGDWTVWLNGRALRPGDSGLLYSIAEVDARRVVLAVAWGENTRLVQLEPNQTFVPSTGQVVEGRPF
ncbi:hypothetical protein [Caenispirillum bisanense]|uniref:General secretion pathway protein C n=1 Tax=Caenispirillum bisanense TaxID=414052 RepID=A0A286GY57_9PROT|nr:hypothetical protein [Caenispirillum bisanense]SOE00019.1 hypothetical protein SAMN05421508_11141 [Caenispirillum bisanense]